MREVRQREPRIGSAQLVVRDDRRDRVEPGAAVRFRHRDSEEPECARLAKELEVQLPGVIAFVRLGLDVGLHEVLDHLAKQPVLLRWMKQVGAHRAPLR